MADTADRIIAAEWIFFDKTRNIGGRAPCQDDLRTFAIMRKSQLSAWDEATLASYLSDLDEADGQGRNPVSEKYAYMMEYSSPSEFRQIASLLPGVSPHKRMVAAEIVNILVRWQEETALRHPLLAGRGRLLRTRDDTPGNVSFETYARGELYTYSERTLERYKAHIDRMTDARENMCEKILSATVRLQGYASIEEAEKAIASSTR
jgi:hypothetical protein